MRLSRPLLVIYVAGFLRSLGVGLLGVILGVYLSRVGIGATSIGFVIGAGLLGACAATAVVAWAGARVGYRSALVALSLLAAVGGVALAALPSFPVLTAFDLPRHGQRHGDRPQRSLRAGAGHHPRPGSGT